MEGMDVCPFVHPGRWGSAWRKSGENTLLELYSNPFHKVTMQYPSTGNALLPVSYKKKERKKKE